MQQGSRFPAWLRRLAGVAGALLPFGVAHAYVVQQNVGFWASGNVVMQLQLGSLNGTAIDGSTTWGQIAEAALFDWNQVLGRIQFTVVRDSTAANASANGLNNVSWGTTVYGDAWGSSTIGICLYRWVIGGNRTESDVVFNSSTNRKWNSYRGNLRTASDGSTLYDLKRVALHEFGHSLGLDHPDQAGQTQKSVMVSVTDNTDALTVDDIAGVKSIYDVAATAPAITTQPQGQTVAVGGTATFTVTATGSSPLSYQWRKDGVAIAGATSATLTLSGVTTANAGTYTVVVSNSAGSVLSSDATLTIGGTSRISNLSVRTTLGSGQNLTVGFVTSGAKNLLIRAVGPSLKTVFGVTNFYADPKFTLNNPAGTVINQNDSWTANLSGTFVSVGAFALDAGSKDAALLASLSGPNTAQVSGTGSGLMLVEVYDADAAGSSTRLTNVSARNQVGTGTDVLVSGFVIAGNAPETLLIRGIGPGLHDFFGIPSAGLLADPMLEVHQTINGVDTVVASNDNWSASLVSTFDAVGAYHFATGSKDAALLVTLQPGIYTAQVSGANLGTGDGVVEIYEAPSGGGTTPPPPPTTYSVNITTAGGTGSGTVTANPPGPYAPGTVVTLTAVPAAGSTFTGWSGGASGSSTVIQVTVTANLSVVALFDVITTGGGGSSSALRVYPGQGTEGNYDPFTGNSIVDGLTLIADGGSPSSHYTWTPTTGQVQPLGVTLEAATGILRSSGASNRVTPGTYYATVSDGSSTANGTVTITVTQVSSNPALFTPIGATVFGQLNLATFPLVNAKANRAYGASLYVDTGSGPAAASLPLAWTLASGSLPEGLSIDQSTGVVRGSVLNTAAGKNYSFRIQVKDSAGHVANISGSGPSYTIHVDP